MKRTIVLLLLVLPIPGLAADGLKEINQACVSAGCFAGDAPGFPVQITEPGGYVLTSTLDVTGLPGPEDVTVIDVTATRVTIDMNGYGLIGPTVCSGAPLNCSPLGSGRGIAALGAGDQVIVRNGFVEGMGLAGVACTESCTIIDVHAKNNGDTGLSAGTIRNSSSNGNGVAGMIANGVISDSIAIGNRFTGIAGQEAVLMRVRANGNGSNGVACIDCNLIDSVSSRNGGFGVFFSGQSAFGGNLFIQNTNGSISGTAIETKPNRCGATVC